MQSCSKEFHLEPPKRQDRQDGGALGPFPPSEPKREGKRPSARQSAMERWSSEGPFEVVVTHCPHWPRSVV